MKKIVILLASAVLFATSAVAEFRVGVSAAFTQLDTSGTETVKSSATKNQKTVEENVLVPSIFFEIVREGGMAIGLDYIPSAEQLGSGTGDDDDAEPPQSLTSVSLLEQRQTHTLNGRCSYISTHEDRLAENRK